MNLENRKIVLASASPRRKEIISLISDNVVIRPAECDETLPEGIGAKEAVEYLSNIKNDAARLISAEDEIIIEVLPDREGNEQTVGLSFDGECNFEMKTGDSIVIRKSEAETELLKLSNDSFLEIMRRKMKGN